MPSPFKYLGIQIGENLGKNSFGRKYWRKLEKSYQP